MEGEATLTMGSKFCDSKPAIRLSRSKVSLLSCISTLLSATSSSRQQDPRERHGVTWFPSMYADSTQAHLKFVRSVGMLSLSMPQACVWCCGPLNLPRNIHRTAQLVDLCRDALVSQSSPPAPAIFPSLLLAPPPPPPPRGASASTSGFYSAGAQWND